MFYNSKRGNTQTNSYIAYIFCYQKYRHPGHANVVERNGALERIAAQLRAVRVVLVPIHARRIRRMVVRERERLGCVVVERKVGASIRDATHARTHSSGACIEPCANPAGRRSKRSATHVGMEEEGTV